MYSMDSENSVKPLGPNQIAYSRGEEWVNIITHLAGAVLAVAAAILMMIKVAAKGEGALAITSICLFSVALINLYVMSTLYHAQPVGKTRRAVFRRFDHCSVALLIAGTYAPYMLIGLGRAGGADRIWGIVIASVVLGLAVLVIVFNAINVNRFKVVCMICYIVMGWSCVIRVTALVRAIGWPCFALLLTGGVIYTLGLIFYRIKKIRYNHAIWHFFVLGGSILHFVSVYFFLI